MTPLNRTGARCFEFLLTLWISLILCASFSLDAFRLQYVNEANWNWRLMKTILTRCHVYDKERYYVPFDELAPEESQPIKFLRKFMPDYAWCHGYCWLEYHWPGEQYNDLEDTVLKTLPNTIDAHPKFWPNYYAKLCCRKGKTIVSERLLKNNANFFSTLHLVRVFTQICKHAAVVWFSNTFVYHDIDTLACFNKFPKVCRQLLANLLIF